MNKRPTHELCFLNKETEEKGKIGVAWQNDDESFSIKLNAWVVIPQDTSKIILTLFKIKSKEEWASAPKKAKKPLTTQSTYEEIQAAAKESDVPF